jgi:hypothetical protein
MGESLDTVDESLRLKLRALVVDVGLNQAAEQVGCSKQTLLRAIASLDINAGSRALFDKWARSRRESDER